MREGSLGVGGTLTLMVFLDCEDSLDCDPISHTTHRECNTGIDAVAQFISSALLAYHLQKLKAATNKAATTKRPKNSEECWLVSSVMFQRGAVFGQAKTITGPQKSKYETLQVKTKTVAKSG